MEKISAACAMEWSIELEKGLRSKNPGVAVESILKMEPRLERWDKEPELTMVAYSMFGLVPGEDRLFASSILLRLADAFRLGDNGIRLAVVKVFLCGAKRRLKEKRKGWNAGILAKMTPENRLELLSRVKVVYNSGDVELRAFSLILFGCWADITKDNADIHYLIFSGLVSSHDMEVRASLFAARCLSQLLDDFTFVVLEILINMVNSPPIPCTIKLAGLKTIPTLKCSPSLTNRAYKACKKLVENCPEDEFFSTLLISLSKLACKSTLLISEQVELLLSFVSPKTFLPTRITALRCLHFILSRGSHFPITSHFLKILVTSVEHHELKNEGFRILRKIPLNMLTTTPWIDILVSAKLFEFLKTSAQSPVMLNRVLSYSTMLQILAKIGKTEIGNNTNFDTCMPSEIISLIMHQMMSLMQQTLNCGQTDSEIEQEGRSLLKLLLDMVVDRPDLCTLVLENTFSSIDNMTNMQNEAMDMSEPDLLVHEILESKQKLRSSTRSKLPIYLYRFIMACLELLIEAGLLSAELLLKLRRLVKHVHKGGTFDWYERIIYILLLHTFRTFGSIKEMGINPKLPPSEELDEHEICALESVNKMLNGKDYWSAYQTGTHALKQGAWVMASYIFEQLRSKVQSYTCQRWLKLLAQLSYAERKIYFLFAPKAQSSLDNWLAANESFIMLLNKSPKIMPSATLNSNLLDHIGKIGEVYSALCNSKGLLEIRMTCHEPFFFQRWFLALRGSILQTVLDTLRILSASLGIVVHVGDGNSSILRKCASVIQQNSTFMNSISYISSRFKRLAQECDLIAASFLSMDRKSSKIISELALSCSLLAFSTQFALFLPNLPAYDTSTDCGLEDINIRSHGFVLQDFFRRLSHIDQETSTNLTLLLKVTALPRSCYHIPNRSIVFPSGRNSDICQVCSHTVTEVIHLRNEANNVPRDDEAHLTMGGSQLLSSIITRWLCIPFQIPSFFFQFRPLIGSELFATNSEFRNPENIAIPEGFHLSLNLCLQLQNIPPDFSSQVTKLYSVLHCQPSCQKVTPNEEQGQNDSEFPVLESDDLVDLNQILMHHVTRCTGTPCRSSDKQAAKAFVRFIPNERGQGFSTCLLDVSRFPIGTYRIKWLSCCIDKLDRYWSFIPLNAGPVFTVHRPLN